MRIHLVLLGALVAPPALAQPAIELGLPVDCTLGVQCFVQQYVDVDPGPEARDFRCGPLANSDHKGVDFRAPSLAEAARIAVIAAAPGVVRGTRDGVPDRFLTEDNAAEVADQECGNGLVIAHDGGWETQYCHLQRGSVAVRSGERVEKGQKLGVIGASGFTQFPHAHLSVRHDDQIVDPFLGVAIDGSCDAEADAASGLWDAEARAQLDYADAQLIEAGFADHLVAMDEVETGGVAPPGPGSAALVFYGRAINLLAGDSMRLELFAPDGSRRLRDFDPMDRKRARQFYSFGVKLQVERWPAGAYHGRVTILRDGAALRSLRATLTMP